MTNSTIAVFGAHRVTKACRTCGQPIVLAKLVSTGSWMAFEAAASGPKRQSTSGALIEDLRLAERHQCQSGLFPPDQVEATT